MLAGSWLRRPTFLYECTRRQHRPSLGWMDRLLAKPPAPPMVTMIFSYLSVCLAYQPGILCRASSSLRMGALKIAVFFFVVKIHFADTLYSVLTRVSLCRLGFSSEVAISESLVLPLGAQHIPWGAVVQQSACVLALSFAQCPNLAEHRILCVCVPFFALASRTGVSGSGVESNSLSCAYPPRCLAPITADCFSIWS
ncbi:unnamed protein product [Polarella glacialis]|uniref:Uncharacterized protein n=1 Tax=Polarella glacialis TaxID=89957 RepID=A0A813IPZ7_POLGL|nr:unnamed protein product [Polarella glacialis]